MKIVAQYKNVSLELASSNLFLTSILIVIFGFSTFKVHAQLFVNTSNFKVVSGTTVVVPDQVAGADLIVGASGKIVNDGTIVLDPTATLQETTNGAGLGILSGAGTIEITQTLNAPTALNVGGLGMTLTTADNLGSTQVIRGHTPYIANSNPSIERFYRIYPTNNTALNVDMTFAYDQKELNGYTEANLQLIASTDATTWDLVPASTIDAIANTFNVTGISSLQIYAVQSSMAALPIEFIYFSATNDENKRIVLNWATATEMNNDFFEIQRSVDGRTFERIGEVTGNGTSDARIDYNFTDNYPYAGQLYYRLKQVDFNGEFTFTKVVGIYIDAIQQLEMYPNPASDFLNIALTGNEAVGRKLVIIDSRGQKIMETEMEVMSQYTRLDTSNLQNGYYIVWVYDQQNTYKQKFLIER